MSKVDQDRLEDLLKNASPRPVPSPADEADVRAAVQQEWLNVTGKRRTRRRITQYALAASVVLAAFAAFNTLRTPSVAPVQAATIAKSFGAVYLLGESSELRETTDLTNILVGHTILTGENAGLALAWGGGGTLRMDAGTRVFFAGVDAARLESGRIYFDSHSPGLVVETSAGASSAFALETEHGDVRHLGTQFMTQVDARSLVVSVREGAVEIDGRYHDRTVEAGQQVTLAGSQQPSVLSIARSGGSWAWLEKTTPAADVDGKTLHEFLLWVSREMGLELQFEGRAEAVARTAVLRGTIDTEPADALRLRVATAALEWRIDKGVIYISDPAR